MESQIAEYEPMSLSLPDILVQEEAKQRVRQTAVARAMILKAFMIKNYGGLSEVTLNTL